MAELIIRGGTILTIDSDWRVLSGDVASRDGEIVQVGGRYTPRDREYELLDASGCLVMPGLVQSHVHMCQTLARGRADNLELLDWLRWIVWPYEAELDAGDVAAAARLACVELLMGGTTCVLDMATVRHTGAIFEVARAAGLRATIGKAMMDSSDNSAALRERTIDALDESARLCETWNGAENGRLRYAYSPRFALSCTDELLREVARVARHRGVRIHTHASENRAEIAEVVRRTGMENIHYLHSVGLTGDDVCLAHCVWLSEGERRILAETGTHVLHCPSSNFKLASGVAEIPELIEAGISVSLGADGAPCNNNLDGFLELRLAALLHKPRCGPRAMHAALVLRMATLDGARALGLADQIGSLEVGKRADVIVVNMHTPHVVPTVDPFSAAVYAVRAADVRHVAVDGQVAVRDRHLLTLDIEAVMADARERSRGIFDRLEQKAAKPSS
ncbi:MAG: 5'-deoxyadenosine deaminase [Proteobacteria bacterium]|nr:5'-deoxyadenosine deaminase [Pseudomonadota bacterium]